MTERYFCQSVRLEERPATVKILASPHGTILVQSALGPNSSSQATNYSSTIYLGPRDYFYLKKSGFESAFPIGALGKIGLALLLVLSWIASITRSYGLAIIVFSALVTCAMAPFTLISFRSMRKMQELKPQVDKIMTKHKNDQKAANQELFALYKTHKVSPVSGCLPMLLQMPVFIALFQAISHFVELRGKSFWWIADLSLPDRLAKLPFTLPLLGKDVNALPIIMAAAMYFQTKTSQQATTTIEDNQSLKMLSGPLMPVMFCLMFYSFPSGLVLYWLSNTIGSLALYQLAKSS